MAIAAEKKAHKDVLLVVAARPDPEVDPERKRKAQPKDCQHAPRPVRGVADRQAPLPAAPTVRPLGVLWFARVAIERENRRR